MSDYSLGPEAHLFPEYDKLVGALDSPKQSSATLFPPSHSKSSPRL